MGMDKIDALGRSETRGDVKASPKNAFKKLSFEFKIDGKKCRWCHDETGEERFDCSDDIDDKCARCTGLLQEYLERRKGVGLADDDLAVFLRKWARMMIKKQKIMREIRFRKLWATNCGVGVEVE
jgi:hypothetical protein